MHGPTGSSGVQRPPNIRHCSAQCARRSRRRSGRQSALAFSTAEFLFGVKLCKLSRRCKPARIIAPRPRHRSRRGTKHSFIIFCASGFPVRGDCTLYIHSQLLGSPSAICFKKHVHRAENILRLEAAYHRGHWQSRGRNSKPRSPIIVAHGRGRGSPRI